VFGHLELVDHFADPQADGVGTGQPSSRTTVMIGPSSASVAPSNC
jgi:hypothetical protein